MHFLTITLQQVHINNLNSNIMETREVKNHIKNLNNLLRRAIYEPTEVIAQAGEDGESIEVVACGGLNNGHSFHHMDEITDYCRAFQLNCYAFIEVKEIKIRIF